MIKSLSFCLLFCLLSLGTQAQQKPVKNCVLPADSAKTYRVSLVQAQNWADKLPLEVVCDGTSYFLSQFTMQIITMNPLQTREFGTGNDGIPLLARKAMNDMKPKDSVFFKDVTAKDSQGNVVKLPNVVFSIRE